MHNIVVRAIYSLDIVFRMKAVYKPLSFMKLLCLLFHLVFLLEITASSTCFNVLDYGALGNGENDDSEAFLKAWKDLCEAEGSNYSGPPTMEIPCGKTFKLKPVHFQGPCKSTSVRIQVSGTIIAPAYLSGWTSCVGNSWLRFSNVGNLIINGSGTIDGQGENWWHKHKKDHNEIIGYDPTLPYQAKGICYDPTALHLHNCSNLQLRGLTHVNSPRNHISISSRTYVTLSHLNISAPESSPNTDGIDLYSTTQVLIQESTIATGDDCIAIKGNCSKTNITGIMCGPGHGISVGSLGAGGAYETVEEVFVGNCTFKGSMYGARIKTWQGGSGYARNVHFEHIQLMGAGDPIIIDQFYCNGRHDCKNMTKAVSVSNVTYRGVRGTSANKNAVTLKCANTNCTNIQMNHVNITSGVIGSEVSAFCLNAIGTYSCTTPTVPCLYHDSHGEGYCGSEDSVY